MGSRTRLTVPSGDEAGAGGSFFLEEPDGRVQGLPNPCRDCFPWGTKCKHHAEIHSGSSRAKSVVGIADSPKYKKDSCLPSCNL